MIRDTFFSMSRFVNLCRKETVESWKTNLLRFVIMYGIMAFAFVSIGYFKYKDWAYIKKYYENEDPVWRFGLLIFVTAVIIMGMLSASFIMERMKTKTNRIAVLMTPATMFEKFFSRWLVFTFGFLIAFLVTFELADWTRAFIYAMAYPEIDEIGPMPFSFFHTWGIFQDNMGITLSISMYFFAQSIFVLGSAIWPKGAYIKTFSAVLVLAIVFVLIGATVIRLLTIDKMHGIYPPMTNEQLITLVTIFFFFIAIVNNVLAYFRFKESEIINRW